MTHAEMRSASTAKLEARLDMLCSVLGNLAAKDRTSGIAVVMSQEVEDIDALLFYRSSK